LLYDVLGSLLVQQIGFLSHWDPYAVISLEAVAYSWHSSYRNAVEWFWWDWTEAYLSGQLATSSALTLLIWPVKIVSEMTYKVFSGTLSLYSLTHENRYNLDKFKAYVVENGRNWKESELVWRNLVEMWTTADEFH